MRDNLVLVNADTIAKVARPGGEGRVANGLRAACTLADAGVPAVRPLVEHPCRSELGVVTYWPRVEHTLTPAALLSVPAATELGNALGAIAHVGPERKLTWDPFSRLAARVRTGSRWACPGELELLQSLADTVRGRVRDAGADLCGPLAHGDVSLTNVLHTQTGIQLIDFDSSAPSPPGWDLACLLLRLRIEADNAAAANAAMSGWVARTTAPTDLALEALMAVKLVMATSFLLTLGHDPHARATFTRRLLELEGPLRAGNLPDAVAALD